MMEDPGETEKTIPPPVRLRRTGGGITPACPNAGGNKRSRFVTLIAVLTLVIGGFLSFFFAMSNLIFMSMFSSPVFQLSMENAVVPAGTPPAVVFLALHTRGFFFFSLIMWLSVTAIGFGVLRRAKWGRGGFVPLLYIGAATLFLIFLFPELFVPKPLFYQGVSLAPEFNAAVTAARLVLQIFCGFGTALFFWLARKFESEEIKKEFG